MKQRASVLMGLATSVVLFCGCSAAPKGMTPSGDAGQGEGGGGPTPEGGTAETGASPEGGAGDTGVGGHTCKSGPSKSTCAPGKVALGPAKSYPVGVATMTLAVADLNGDGKDDIVVEAEGPELVVLQNNGDGTFAAAVNIPDPVGNGSGLAVADFNGDCAPDILVTSFSNATVDNYVDLFLGKGDGTFGSTPTSTTNISPNQNLAGILTGDFNGDGKLDFACASYPTGGGVSVVLNSGGSMFAGPGATFQMDDSNTYLQNFAAADLNGDQLPDFVAAGAQVCVTLNAGNAQFTATPVCYATVNNSQPDKVAIADVNGDGHPDVVVSTSDTDGGNSFEVFLNDGKGILADPASYVIGTDSNSDVQGFVLSDVNNDGAPDFVAVTSYGQELVQVFSNKGDGTFMTTAMQYSAGEIGGEADLPIAAGDFLGNGLNGFVVINNTNNTVDVVEATCNP